MTIFEFFLWSLLKVAVVTVVTLMAVAYTVLLERKLVGRIQNRWGPSRVGPFGLLQPLVDGLKSFLKEDIIPTGVYRPLYLLAPIISLACALLSIAVVPFGEPGIGPHGLDLFEISNRSKPCGPACGSPNGTTAIESSAQANEIMGASR